MTSKTVICNRALIKLGEPRVSNIDTTQTTSAQTLSQIYDTVRDSEQAAYPWNFCLKLASLAADATAPLWTYNYYSTAYTLPSDFLAMYSVENDPDYKIINRKIHINQTGALNIMYISRVSDEAQFDPLFTEALAARLAHEACERVKESNTKKSGLLQEYQIFINRAYASQAIQEPSEPFRTDRWIQARLDNSAQIMGNE